MKHLFTRCIICKTPYMDKPGPYICPRCQENGKAAGRIAAQAARIAQLEAALDEIARFAPKQFSDRPEAREQVSAWQKVLHAIKGGA